MDYVIAYLFIFAVAMTFLMNVIYYIAMTVMAVCYTIKNKKLPNWTWEDIKAPPSWEDW